MALPRRLWPVLQPGHRRYARMQETLHTLIATCIRNAHVHADMNMSQWHSCSNTSIEHLTHSQPPTGTRINIARRTHAQYDISCGTHAQSCHMGNHACNPHTHDAHMHDTRSCTNTHTCTHVHTHTHKHTPPSKGRAHPPRFQLKRGVAADMLSCFAPLPK